MKSLREIKVNQIKKTISLPSLVRECSAYYKVKASNNIIGSHRNFDVTRTHHNRVMCFYRRFCIISFLNASSDSECRVSNVVYELSKRSKGVLPSEARRADNRGRRVFFGANGPFPTSKGSIGKRCKRAGAAERFPCILRSPWQLIMLVLCY